MMTTQTESPARVEESNDTCFAHAQVCSGCITPTPLRLSSCDPSLNLSPSTFSSPILTATLTKTDVLARLHRL